jgi:hypothetical protein
MSASTWHGLVGIAGYAAGASGSVTLPVGVVVLQILAHATTAGTITIFGGPSIPVIAGTQFSLDCKDTLLQSTGTGGVIVFTGTDSYFVRYVRQGNAI